MRVKKIIFMVNVVVFTLMVMQISPQLVYAGEGHGHEESRKSKKEDDHGHGNKEERDDHGEESGHGNKGDHDEHGEEEGHNEEGEGGHDENGLNLDAEARKMINLKTARVEKRKLGGRLKVYGKIAKDTENYSYVNFNGEGRVGRIKVDLGQMVSKGDKLLTITLEDGSSKTIYSSMHGIILSIFVKSGERVDSLTSLISIMDVDTLRATIDIYERDLRFVEEGQEVILKTSAYPENKFYGKVVYISPQVNDQTQSIKVRVDVENPKHLLRLGMFVYGDLIYSLNQGSVLTVPTLAIQELNGEDIVFVSEEGKLELREVILGRNVGRYTEIKSGLSLGERVVTQGSFYLKSEKAKSSFGGGHSH